MTALVAAAGLVVMWSSGFVGARLGTAEAPADTLLAWRYLAAAAILVAIVVVRRPRWRRADLPRQALLGLLCQCLYLAGVVTGVGLGVPAGVAALIAVLQPLVVGALAGPVLGERVRPRQWLGLAAGVGGVGLVVAGDAAVGGPPLGYALVAGGMLALSAGTLLERRWRLATPLLDSLTIHCLVSAAVFVASAALAGRLAPPAGAGFWWAVAWVVVLSTFGGYGCYLLALRIFGATGASTLLYLTPPTTMLWALSMFGERIGWLGVVGLVACAGSVWLVLSANGRLRWTRGRWRSSSTRRVEPAFPSSRSPTPTPRSAPTRVT
ncbi:MAG: DMT family transporter [Actinophytocola sp.]|uniref:DMT family transporter n=1 Tax=Actinophytocola sp. TaxID=1872138 RepID=UPI003D6C1A3F